MFALRSRHLLALSALVLGAPPPCAAATPQEQAAPQPGPTQVRKQAFDRLFARLRQAPDPEAAAPVRAVIVKLWEHNGSPTADLLMARVESLLHAGKGAAAAVLLDRIVILYPDWTLGWRRRAQSALLQGDSEGAMLDLNHALAMEPRDFLALTELATLMRAEGKNTPALDLLRRALEIDPQNDDLRQEMERLARKVEGDRI